MATPSERLALDRQRAALNPRDGEGRYLYGEPKPMKPKAPPPSPTFTAGMLLDAMLQAQQAQAKKLADEAAKKKKAEEAAKSPVRRYILQSSSPARSVIRVSSPVRHSHAAAASSSTVRTTSPVRRYVNSSGIIERQEQQQQPVQQQGSFTTSSTLEEVTVPEGVVPGQKLLVGAPGAQVRITVPEGVRPGQKLRVQVPAAAAQQPPKSQPISQRPSSHRDALPRYVHAPPVFSSSAPTRIITLEEQGFPLAFYGTPFAAPMVLPDPSRQQYPPQMVMWPPSMPPAWYHHHHQLFAEMMSRGTLLHSQPQTRQQPARPQPPPSPSKPEPQPTQGGKLYPLHRKMEVKPDGTTKITLPDGTTTSVPTP